jgi:hypothetical protein
MSTRETRRREVRWLVGAITGVVLALAFAWVLVVPAADWLARHDVGPAHGALLQTARDAARGRILTLAAGLFAAGALVFTALNFVLARRTFELAERGQVTDRYARAVDQLGSEKLDVRVGGIYALERIARDSAADRATIGEVLTAFIRGHAPWPPSLPGQYVATAPISQVPKLQTRAPDVQASLWVLGRGGFADALGDDQWLDLTAVDLRRADLRDARLGAADLRFAALQRAFLGGSYLEGAHLEGSDLEGARLVGAHLLGAVGNERTRWPDGFDWRAVGIVTAESHEE